MGDTQFLANLIGISAIVIFIIKILIYIITFILLCYIAYKIGEAVKELKEIKKQSIETNRLLDINNSLTAREINEIQNRN